MDDNIIEFPARQPERPAEPDRLQELIALEHEVFELRNAISFLTVELVSYRQRFG